MAKMNPMDWISCKELLPVKSKLYIVFTDDGFVEAQSFFASEEEFEDNGNGIATHWMPLPAPPVVEGCA